MTNNSRTPFLDLAAYLTVFAVGFVGTLEIKTIFQRWVALGIFILISVVISQLIQLKDTEIQRKRSAYLGALTLLVSCLLLLNPHSSVFHILFFVLCPLAFLVSPTRQGIVWMFIFIIITGIQFIYMDGWSEGLQSLLYNAGGFFFFGVVANALSRARQAQRESEKLLLELSLANRQLREYSQQVEALTVIEERNRLSREMHDTLGHRLTVAAVQLEAAQRLIPTNPDRAAIIVGTVREQVRESLKELRQTVARLREPVEAELPLAQALRQLVASFQEATALEVNLKVQEELEMLSIPSRRTIYRAVQEGLTNIQRHAHATEAWVDLQSYEDKLRLVISDNGTGFLGAEPGEGFGLTGIQERAGQLGGTLSLEQRPGGGAQLVLSLPVLMEKTHA